MGWGSNLSWDPIWDAVMWMGRSGRSGLEFLDPATLDPATLDPTHLTASKSAKQLIPAALGSAVLMPIT